jgi:hypothetical protein
MMGRLSHDQVSSVDIKIEFFENGPEGLLGARSLPGIGGIRVSIRVDPR